MIESKNLFRFSNNSKTSLSLPPWEISQEGGTCPFHNSLSFQAGSKPRHHMHKARVLWATEHSLYIIRCQHLKLSRFLKSGSEASLEKPNRSRDNGLMFHIERIGWAHMVSTALDKTCTLPFVRVPTRCMFLSHDASTGRFLQAFDQVCYPGNRDHWVKGSALPGISAQSNCLRAAVSSAAAPPKPPWSKRHLAWGDRRVALSRGR